MKPEEIIELAKKAGYESSPKEVVFSCNDHFTKFSFIRFAALHREALIASGELVPRERVEADKRDAERYVAVRDILSAEKLNEISISSPTAKDFDEAIDRARSQP